MRIPRVALVAATLPLLLTSLRVTAGELPFNAPATEQARQSAPLLHRTAHALHDLPSSAALRLLGGKQISHLWLFPTAAADTVFARYNLTSNEEAMLAASGSATQHLTVLRVEGNRIVESRELTSLSAELVANDPPRLHWSALIGTGGAARANLTLPQIASSKETHHVPPSPHWSALIGTGTVATSTTAVADAKQRSLSGAQPGRSIGQPIVAAAHWTSRIGTGHPLD